MYIGLKKYFTFAKYRRLMSFYETAEKISLKILNLYVVNIAKIMIGLLYGL